MNIQSFADLKLAIQYASHESGEEGWHDLEDMVVIKREGDLLMFSYTNECNSKPPTHWTWLEKVSRGLIMNAKTGEIIARPFEKFWNLDFNLNTAMVNGEVEGFYQKADGSLGIIYHWKDKWRVSTRGSFNSKQAIWAQEYIDKNCDFSHLNTENTVLVEIIYPENRVVVDYHGLNNLILLDVINKHAGKGIKDYTRLQETAANIGIMIVDSFNFDSHEELIESLKNKEGSDFEGYVVKMKNGRRWKIKSEEYVKLHRIISNFRFKRILEMIQAEDYEERRKELMEICPEYYKEVFRKYEHYIINTEGLIKLQVELYMKNAPKGDRKEFALWVHSENNNVSKEYRSYMFAAYDNKNITPLIYRNAFNFTEEEIRKELGITGDTSFDNG